MRDIGFRLVLLIESVRAIRNANPQGMCGGFMSAWSEVRPSSEIVLPRHAFEFGDWHVAEPATTEIIIEAGGKEPVIKKIPWDDFYK